jgi:hypothetical protein
MKLSRAQLAKFLPDNDSIRAFEELFALAESADTKVGDQTLLTAKSATTTTLVDIVSLNVSANTLYRFEFYGAFTTASVAVGTRWVVAGPATSVLSYSSRYPLSATAETVNHLSAFNLPASANASSANGTVRIDGMVKPSASGQLTFKVASGGASAVNLVGGYVRLIRLT